VTAVAQEPSFPRGEVRLLPPNLSLSLSLRNALDTTCFAGARHGFRKAAGRPEPAGGLLLTAPMRYQRVPALQQ
jgi:hypothetical protein